MDAVGYGITNDRRYVEDSTWLGRSHSTILLPRDGSEIELFDIRLEGDRDGPGSVKLNMGNPLLFSYPDGSDRVVAQGYNLDGPADYSFVSHLHPSVVVHLLDFLDPDRDGIMRGFLDVIDSSYEDLDGDGLSEARVDTNGVRRLTGNDNCPPGSDFGRGTYNRDQQDTDGDGVGDQCDMCPDVFDPEQIRCQTVRGEFLSPVCGEQNRDWGYAPPATRGEHNRVPLDADNDGVWDTCQFCFGAPDCDGDGIGDPCEPDSDSDGVPDDCDTCPSSAFPASQNCNHDSELQMRAMDPDYPIRPDGCDPNPCAETWVETSTSLDGMDRTVRMDQILVDPRAAGMDQNPMLLPGESVVAGQALDTGFRFCPCPEAGENTVAARARCATDFGCSIADVAAYDEPNEEAPWVHFRVAAHDPAVQLDDALWAQTYQPPTHLYDPDGTGTWQRAQDLARWSTIGGDTGTDGSGAIPDVARGVLWTHTRGPVGDDPFFEERRRLTNHYWSGTFAGDYTATRPWPCLSYAGPFAAQGLCPHCTASFPGAFIGFGGEFVDFCNRVYEDPVLALPELPWDLGPLLAPVEAYLREWDWVWRSAAEPPELLGNGDPILVAVAEDGTARQTLRMGDAALVPGIELDVGPDVEHFVLSASRRELFAIDQQGPDVEVRATSLTTGVERSVHASGGWSVVVAAAYSARTNRILLLRLDSTDGWLELIGIDADTGQELVLRSSGQVPPECGSYQVREDVAGGLWVVADVDEQLHTVAYVAFDDAGGWSGPALHDVGSVPRAPLEHPGASDVMVDQRGLSLPLADGTVRGVRLRDLDDESIQCF